MMRGLIVFSNHMEDVEALGTRALLVRAGYEMDSIANHQTKTLKTAYGQSIIADYLIDDIDVDDYDFIVIPGGKYVMEVIDTDIEIKSLIKRFNDANKVICAICAAPRFLGRLGLLNHIKYTAFPGSEVDIEKGIYLPDAKAVQDDRFITARSAGAIYEFVYEIIQYFEGKSVADKLLNSIFYEIKKK